MEIENRNNKNDIESAPDRKYVRKDSFILRNIAGSNVLISVGENIANFNGYIQLNETAAFLWERLNEPQSVVTLTQALMNEFDVDSETACADAKEFLIELIKEGMVNQYAG